MSVGETQLSQIKYQRQALEMAAHTFWWDRANLTPLQIRSYWSAADDAISAWDATERPPLEARHSACGAIILKVMLTLGQPRERARQLRYELVNPPIEDDLERLCLLKRDHVTFLILSPDSGRIEDAKPLGFLLPAITPDYRKEPPGATARLGRPRQACLALPDLTNLGDQLLRWFRKQERQANPDRTVLGVHPETADASVNQFFKTYDARFGAGLRLSESAFARWLAVTCEVQTGDQSLAWMVTADLNRRNESRLHYTQHMACRLLDAYAGAIRRLRVICQP